MLFHTFCSAKFSTCIAVRLLKFSVLHGKGESKYRPVATNFQCLKNCCPLSHPCWGKRLSGQSPSICCRRPRCHLKAPLGLSLLHFVSQTRTCRSETPPFCLRKNVLSLESPTGAFIASFRFANAKLSVIKYQQQIPLSNDSPVRVCLYWNCVLLLRSMSK